MSEEVDLQGQITLPLGGTEYHLRPSFAAIIRIEKITGKSHEQLAQDAVQMRMSYEDMAVVCAEMMRAYGEADPKAPSGYRGAKAEKLQSLIYGEGKPKIGARLAVVLIGALNGGYTAEGELKATGIQEATPVAE